jgi:hypothetical protein
MDIYACTNIDEVRSLVKLMIEDDNTHVDRSWMQQYFEEIEDIDCSEYVVSKNYSVVVNKYGGSCVMAENEGINPIVFGDDPTRGEIKGLCKALRVRMCKINQFI